MTNFEFINRRGLKKARKSDIAKIKVEILRESPAIP
jgi:hypothetical protein